MPHSDRYRPDSNLEGNLTFPVYLYTPTHARSAPLELFLQSLAKELLFVMQQIQLFSVCSSLGFRFREVLGRAILWRETAHVGEPIQNRYKTDNIMKVEFAVQISAKPIQEKTILVVGT